MRRMLIIGGSDAGISAALRAREIDPSCEVTMIASDRFPNFSICGLPFYLGGETRDWRLLAHRSVEEIRGAGIRLLLEHLALAVDPARRAVEVRGPDRSMRSLEYDELVIATGAVSARPAITGLDMPGVFFLRWLQDAFAIERFLKERNPRFAVVIGGGYIGLEMAEALTRRGMRVTLVEYAPEVLTTFDPELGSGVRRGLESHGVQVKTGTPVSAIEQGEKRLRVIGAQGFSAETDIVIVAAGAAPSSSLAAAAGCGIGKLGAVRVDRRMRTGVPHIFAAGDCVETWHCLLEINEYLPLGTTAHKQGRVAGENAAGGDAKYRGSLGTQSVKVFDLVAARTGISGKAAKAAGFDPLTTGLEAWDHKAYYPGASRMSIRVTGDRRTGKLLGCQILGHSGSEISKRVDILAAAIHCGMKMEEISDLDLSYTPPLSSPWDPVQAASQQWLNERSGSK